MNDDTNPMVETLRLTREGRFAEAFASLQRGLAGPPLAGSARPDLTGILRGLGITPLGSPPRDDGHTARPADLSVAAAPAAGAAFAGPQHTPATLPHGL